MKITPEFLNKYNKTGPRYTSYPPATSFSTNFTTADFIPAVIKSNEQYPESISIYIHIPFCPQLCHFCGCNTTAFESAAKIRRYIDCVLKEIDTVAQHIDKARKVSQIHWGGGTPNSINFDYLAEITEKIKSLFQFTENPEIAIECSPAYLTMEDIDRLAVIGFNRVSMGIQDFNPEVLKAINRRPPKFPIEQVMERLRQNNFKGINLDLVYGLPLQTLESFKQNVEKAISLSPDRIVTFSYAHVPWVNPNQKKMDENHMAGPEEKLQMLLAGYEIMTSKGYEAIGMDHFAKPTDNLAIAKHNKNLHRNFQGYCTRETTGQVYAFGTSSISQLWGTYAQNIKNLHHYMDAIEATGLATERGYSMSNEEIIIREVINQVMCNGYLNFEEIAQHLKCSAGEVIAVTGYHPSKLDPFIEDGLVEIIDNNIHVSADGMFVVRNIAMLFDPFLGSTDFSIFENGMTGVLLINMGSPLSKKEMRQFLFNMFSDKAILPFLKIPRTMLAFMISTFRHSGSWKKYQQIGGSKLKESMKLINEQLASEIGNDYIVTSAYSYSKPGIQQGVETLRDKGIKDIRVITMYPHSAYSTTESVKTDLAKIQKKYPDLKMTELGTYGENELFINYWVDTIQKAIDKYGYKHPTLVFSAHAIPQYNVDDGDTYVDEIKASAKLIANKMKLSYRVAFQSKIGKVKWVDPDTKDCLKTMKAEGIDEIMLVPISFVNENLETAYDQGIEIAPFGKEELGFKHICRVEIPASHPLLIATFKQLLIEK